MDALPRFDLQGKIALVTGAARGLGRAIALALAEAGADVALGLRDRGSDSGVTAEVVGRGRKALPLQMDMTSPEQIRQAVDITVQHFGRLERGGRTLHRFRIGDYRVYFERHELGVVVHRILSRNTLKDFLYRSSLPTGEDEALQENPKFWEMIESARLTPPKKE